MNGKIVAGASIGAVLGAGLWFVVALMLQSEWALAAWAVGGFVGLGARFAGAEDQTSGLLCAALTVVAILAGKAAIAQWVLPAEIKSFVADDMRHELNSDAYAEAMTDANDWGMTDTSDLTAVAQYMIDHEYAYGEASDVSTEQILEFRTSWGETLMRTYNAQPSYDAWKEARLDQAVTGFMVMAGATNPFVFAAKNLGLMDILFFGLGIATAFKLGAGLVQEH